MANRMQVDGKDIIERRPAKTPLSTDDRVVYYRQVEELVLSDGSIVYGCIHCKFVGARAISVGSHLKSHGTYIPVDVSSMTIEELVEAATKSTTDTDRYRALYSEAKTEISHLKSELKDYKRKLGAVSALFKNEE